MTFAHELLLKLFNNLAFIGLTCRWFEWDSTTSTDEHTLSLKSSEKVLEQLEDVGQQLAMAFNNEGSLLAVGGEVKNYKSSLCHERNQSQVEKQITNYVIILS